MKCCSRFVSLILTAFFFLGPLSIAPLDAASYGSGKKSYSSSSSSRSSSSSSSRSSSSFSNRKSSSSLSSSRSSSSSFKSGSSSYSSGRSYSSPSSSSVRYDSDAAKAKKSSTTSSGTTRSSGGSSDNYTSRPTPTPTPKQQKFANYLTRPAVVYRDRYDNDFWWWLLDQPRPVRARWAYHHTNTMAPERYEALMRADEGLQEQVTALELEKVSIDADYVPEGLQKHWMYSAFIPSSQLEREARAAAAARTPAGRFWFWFWMIGGGGFLIWLVFIKRWGGSPRAQFA